MNFDELINPSWKKEYDKLLHPSYLNYLESPALKHIKEITESNLFSSMSLQESLATKILNDFNANNDLAASAFNKVFSFPSINELIKPNLDLSNLFKSPTIESIKKISESIIELQQTPHSSAVQMMNQLENLSSFKALKTLHNTPLNTSIIELITNNPSSIPLVIDEGLIEMDHQITEELSSCEDFNLLSDNTKRILSYIYHKYILQIILGCITTVIMLNIDIIKEELSLISTSQEIKHLTKHGSSNNKFNPSYLKGYRVTIASDLNFREKPSMKSAIITKLPIGTLVEIIDKSKKSWLLVEIEINGEIEEGWIARRYTTYFK